MVTLGWMSLEVASGSRNKIEQAAAWANTGKSLEKGGRDRRLKSPGRQGLHSRACARDRGQQS